MADRMTMRLWEPAQAHKQLMHAWAECIKPMLIGGNRLVLEVKPTPRHNPHAHRMLQRSAAYLLANGAQHAVKA